MHEQRFPWRISRVSYRAVLECRALMVERLYADAPDVAVVRLDMEAGR
jgi:hypothetical protein